jgi:DNA topoisomerase-1
VQDQHLNIYRKKHGRGFTYLVANKDRLKNKKELSRIKKMVIPPAWKDVRICELRNGHLQATGRDDRDRKVYLYHELWQELRNQTKFYKMSAFAKALPKIRQKLQEDLSQSGMPRTKCLALVLSVMDESYIRIGNQQYAKSNQTYGLSTLRRKHFKEVTNGVQFNFKGKRGVQQLKLIDDPELIAHIKESEEIPGWELFQYYDESGDHHMIDSGMVNDYLHEISDDLYTAKDFRTWGACREFFASLKENPNADDEKEIEKNIITAYDAAADALGNTRAVCRQYYVHPQLPETYRNGTFPKYVKKLNCYKMQPHFSADERCVLDIISDYEIELGPVQK